MDKFNFSEQFEFVHIWAIHTSLDLLSLSLRRIFEDADKFLTLEVPSEGPAVRLASFDTGLMHSVLE